jgi:hypothetical protein
MIQTNWYCTPASVIATPNARATMPDQSVRSGAIFRRATTATAPANVNARRRNT